MLALVATAMHCSAFKLTSPDFKDDGQVQVFCSFACCKPADRLSSAAPGLCKRKQLKNKESNGTYFRSYSLCP